MSKSKRTVALTIAIVAAILLSSALLVPMMNVSAAPALTDQEKRDLAALYAPVLKFNSGEQVFPVDVSYFIDRCDLKEAVGSSSVLVTSTPSATTLGGYADPSRNYYLDHRAGNLTDGGIIDEYRANGSGAGHTVYARVTSDSTGIGIQYWFFYVFNGGTFNNHEGDWEMVEVVLDASKVPSYAAYSQHEQGQKAAWGQVEKDGSAPVVYVARGSHANYYRPYQGTMGPAQDVVGGNGKVLRSADYDLVLLGELGAGNHPASQSWIDYSGRWGDWGAPASEAMGQRGPFGPAFRMDGQMWSIAWADSRAALDGTMLTVELVLSYLALILIALLLVPLFLMVRRAVRKRRAGELRPPYVELLDLRGRRGIANVLVIAGIIIGLVAAFMPFYTASIDANTSEFTTTGYEKVLNIDGISGIQINTLDLEMGVVQIGALPVPLWAFIVVGLLAFVMSTVAAERTRIGRKSITRGIAMFLPLIAVVIAIASVGSVVASLAPAEDRSIETIIDVMASSPFGGEKSVTTSDLGTVGVQWGIGLGAYLLVVAGVLMIAGGALHLASRKMEGEQKVQGGPA
jgi:hypothetical protein